jgi:hypothetical protein
MDLNGGKSAGSGKGLGQWTWLEGGADADGEAGDVGGSLVKRESRVRAHSNTPSSSSSSSKFPPDGGTGLRAVAGYPWFPEEGEPGQGELMFPRWAEIRECEDVNGEWWAGVYAGVGGVFPGGCVKVVTSDRV